MELILTNSMWQNWLFGKAGLEKALQLLLALTTCRPRWRQGRDHRKTEWDAGKPQLLQPTSVLNSGSIDCQTYKQMKLQMIPAPKLQVIQASWIRGKLSLLCPVLIPDPWNIQWAFNNAKSWDNLLHRHNGNSHLSRWFICLPYGT